MSQFCYSKYFLLILYSCWTSRSVLSLDSNIKGTKDVDSSYFFYERPDYPRDCSEAMNQCSTRNLSGVHLIKPDGYPVPFEVYCDNTVDSGGWTVIHRFLKESLFFNRNWKEYKSGFGFLSGELWIGLDKLSFLTNQKSYELRVDVTSDDDMSFYVAYSTFRIGDEYSEYKLTSVGGYSSTEEFTTKEPIDCFDVYQRGGIASGVYSIKPNTWHGPPFQVFCNMTDSGGWTIFQRRVNGSVNFTVGWDNYKDGFGSPDHELWLGNEKIFCLTNQRRYQLRIDFVNIYGDPYYAKYGFFRINNETTNYRLVVESYFDGNAGDSLTAYNNNQDFSTRDRDNDDSPERNLAVNDIHYNHDHNGWWWGGDDHKIYYNSALNSNYRHNIYWDTISGIRGIRYTEMKIRPVDL